MDVSLINKKKLLSEALGEVFLKDELVIKKTIYRLLGKLASKENVEDTLMSSLNILLEKYISTDRFVIEPNKDLRTQVRRLLYGIIKLQCKKVMADSLRENFLPVDEEGRQLELSSNSWTENSVSLYSILTRKWSKQSYYKHHEKRLKREKTELRREHHRKITRAWYSRIKSDIKKYEIYKQKQNARARVRYAERKLGIYKDKRFVTISHQPPIRLDNK